MTIAYLRSLRFDHTLKTTEKVLTKIQYLGITILAYTTDSMNTKVKNVLLLRIISN